MTTWITLSRHVDDRGASTRLARAVGMRVAALAVVLCACGTDYTDSVPYAADPPSVYVAKVKTILVGLPPTSDEIAAVTKDPNALGALVDGWMTTPEYQHKMMVFFELAFQQTQIASIDFVDLIPPRGLSGGRGVPQLIQNVRESFARTVLELTAEGHPLTDSFTTTKVMMTPALMELYAYMDARLIDNAGTVTDQFENANPSLVVTLETKKGPIPLADSMNPASPNYMHFYTPDLPGLTYPDHSCNALDPITANASALSLHGILHGEIPDHKSPTNATCMRRGGSVMDIQFAPTDYTTWKMVTLRKPNSGEAPTRFFDIPTLRTATELVINTPHPGFFSTPAFFANWPTNSSNQMRVTLNQALIVATGAAIDGSDQTIAPSTPGLDPVHSTPGACISCHQLLDPTRSILSATYSWFYYPQTDKALKQEPGLFAFQNVIAPIHTIDDFASQLATHPLVPQAWAQKLCYYVNSAPCDPTDPEFQRIVQRFQTAGLPWNGLVRDILTSPITTNSAQTLTTTKNGKVIAVARRDHLCAALNNRLGFVDICQLDSATPGRATTTLAQIISGLPSDGYGRGAIIPVLPNEPNLFYRAGLENICEAVAQLVVDGSADPNQPGMKQWSGAQPDLAIADFVSIVMAMPPADARAAKVTAVLTDHFTQATQTGATPTDALRSTFVAACLSPSFIGIGM